MISFGKFKKKNECFLALDVGTEAVKAAVFERESQNYRILGSALQYFDESRPFGNDKVILKAKEEAVRWAGKIPEGLLLNLAPNILRSRVRTFIFIRKNPEKIIEGHEAKTIIEIALKETEKEITRSLAKNSGILPQDIKFIDSKILEIKIDGYEVLKLLGYGGRDLEFKVLASFLPNGYFENFSRLFKDFEKLRIVAAVKNLSVLGVADGVFIDIGGEITQICLIRNNNIEIIDEIERGGNDFSRAISQSLGMRLAEARFFKERYSLGILANDTRERTKEILSSSVGEWHSALKSKLKIVKGLIPSAFFVFGGGCLLPEIEELITNDGREAKFLSFSAFGGKNIIDNTRSLNSPQFTNLILLIYA